MAAAGLIRFGLVGANQLGESFALTLPRQLDFVQCTPFSIAQSDSVYIITSLYLAPLVGH